MTNSHEMSLQSIFFACFFMFFARTTSHPSLSPALGLLSNIFGFGKQKLKYKIHLFYVRKLRGMRSLALFHSLKRTHMHFVQVNG